MKTVTVCAAVLVDVDGRVLIARRPEGKAMAGLWEFPGGKVEPGETPEAALIREIREELAIDLCQTCYAPLTFVSHAYEEFHLLMLVYLCRRWEGMVQSQEYKEMRWVRPKELAKFPMPPADLPLIPLLIDTL
ncbi:MAG: 8-oxo-dGTP diphosphatase MutT [Alphaproteobacteria bacterium]|nr:8-oxo-dGTP diphosphatase MutT [Alphaproteobacteria bacterium]